MELSIDFNSIITNLKINYFSNLIKTCEKNNIDKEIIEDKSLAIKDRLQNPNKYKISITRRNITE